MQLANHTHDALQLKIAAQLAPRRWRSDIEQLLRDLESGRDWPQAVESLTKRRADLGALVSAALAAGHPARIILSLFQKRAASRASWQHLVLSLVYPLALLVGGLVVGSLMALATMGFLTRDWSMPDPAMYARVEEFYDAAVGGLLLIAWLLVLVVLAYCSASRSAWLKLVGGVPVLGRPYRWMKLSELLSRISVFSQYQPVLGTSLELTQQSFGSNALAPISGYLVEAIESGEALPNAIHKTIISDARVGMALTLIDSSDLSGSTQRASRMVDQMIMATCNQLRLILPAFILLVVASIIWGTWSFYFEILSLFRQWLY